MTTELLSECGQVIHNRSQAIDHAASCCSVGIPGPEICRCCGQQINQDHRKGGAQRRAARLDEEEGSR